MIFFLLSILSTLTLEEKVGQTLIAHFRGEEANTDAKILIEQAQVGGIIYYNWSNGLHSPQQVLRLSNGLQALAKTPLFIAVDQEGGLVSRLQHGFTQFPGNRALGMTGKPELAEAAAHAMGQEMIAAGVNFNFAPVADVNSNPKNPVIGVRSFGDKAEVVTEFAGRALAGYRKSGVIACLKHFPGHGDVGVDSHYELPVVNKSRKELDAVELLPFRKLAPSADTVMTAHIVVPAIDSKCCATLSPAVLGVLRNDLGFSGLIVSDSLVMEGVLKNCGGSVDEAAIRALEAGCDVLVLGGKCLIGDASNELSVQDVVRVHKSIVEAVREGRLSEEKLNQSVERIITLKNKFKPVSGNLDASNSTLAHEIARLALRTQTHKPLPSFTKSAWISPIFMEEAFVYKDLTAAEIEAAVQSTKEAEVIFVCTSNAWKNARQQQLVNALLATKKPVTLVCLRDPQDADLFPEAHQVICTFSPTEIALEAVLQVLQP